MGARVICGRHAVKAALGRAMVIRLLVAADTNEDLVALARRGGVEVEVASPAELGRKALTPKHQNVVAEAREAPARAGWEELCAGRASPLLLVVDGIEDPRNLGACLRSAAAFDVAAVVHPRRRSAPLTPAARKVASGAAEHVPLVAAANLARELRRMRAQGFTLVGAVPAGGEDLFSVAVSGPLALVVGGEARGLRRLTREACDRLVTIATPGAGAVASLNVAVACGICLAALCHNRG